MKAWGWYALGLWSLALLVAVPGWRDTRALAEVKRDRIQCQADRVAEGAPYWMALNLCGGLDPDGLERDLP